MIPPVEGTSGPSKLEALPRTGGAGHPARAGYAQAWMGAKGEHRSGDTLDLSPEAAAEVAKLKARDAAVRAHEEAHIAAGSGVVKGGASFSYQEGPDGQTYAIGGEVAVDTAPVPDNPMATIAKANAIRAAALAPADPSPQDLSVASQAVIMAADAAFELSRDQPTNGAVHPLVPPPSAMPPLPIGQSDQTPGAYLNITI